MKSMDLYKNMDKVIIKMSSTYQLDSRNKYEFIVTPPPPPTKSWSFALVDHQTESLLQVQAAFCAHADNNDMHKDRFGLITFDMSSWR